MAVDKLVDSTQLDSDLTSVANAIRTKGGTSAQLAFPSGFVSAIESIQTGTAPTGTINISTNGTHDVADYAYASVSVPTGTARSSSDLTASNLTVTAPAGLYAENATKTLSDANLVAGNIKKDVTIFGTTGTYEGSGGGGYSMDDIVTCAAPTGDVVLNSATFIKPYGFYKTEITSIKATEVLEVGEYAFAEADTLTKVCLPKATTLGNRAFTKLKPMILVAPSVTSMATFLFQFPVTSQGTFVLDFGESLTSIQGNVFIQTDNANDVIMILRNKNAVVTAGNLDAMPKAFWNGNRTAKLYVPSSLLSSYQAASNWATAYAHTGTQFLAIEGSIYENQYADGTAIPSA